MALSYFEDKLNPPDEQSIHNVIGNLYSLWEKIEIDISQYGEIEIEWKFFSKISGWCKKVIIKKGKRNILFAYPNIEKITCVMVFGENAINNMSNYKLTNATIERVRRAKKFLEGVSISYEVVSESNIQELSNLIKMKMEN